MNGHPIDDFDDFNRPLGAASGASRFPTVKFQEVNDQFVGMVIDYDDAAPLYLYGTGDRKVTPNGKPQTKDVLTLLVMVGTTCPVTDPGGGEGAALADPVGVVAKVHIQGHNRWTSDKRPDSQLPAWRNAMDANGSFRRGCVVKGKFEATTRVGANGAKLSQDKKIIGFAIREAKADEADLIERCRQEYGRIKAAKADEPVTVPQRSGSVVDDSDAF